MGLFYLLYGGVIRIFHANLFKIHVHIHRDQEPSNFVPRSNSTHVFQFFDYCSKTKNAITVPRPFSVAQPGFRVPRDGFCRQSCFARTSKKQIIH